jgi:hypothetical protein
MSLTGGTAFGTQQVPVFYRVSTQNNPAIKTIQIQSDYPLIYAFSSQNGGPLGVSQAPSGVSPLIATWTFGNIPYPTTVDVTVYDAASHIELTSTSLDLFGGDVYKVRITYTENIPAANGYIQVMIDGNRTMVLGTDYIQQEFYNSDVWPRGTD